MWSIMNNETFFFFLTRLCLKQYLSPDLRNFSEHCEPFQVCFPQNWKGTETKFLGLIQLVRTKDI